MIVARVLAREPVTIDQAFFLNRIREADALRQRLIPGRSVYRVIHSEGDRLPGLIVDRYDEAIVIQILTAGMERRQKMILDALDELFHPRLVIARNDSTMREHEGLARERLVLRGDSPTDITVLINGLKVSVDLWAGQKTGLFLDQMDNYHLAERIAAGARVLDCFCYLGIWGLHAAQAGASRVLGIDRSEAAIQQAQRIAKANGYEDRCNFQTGNVFDELRERDRRRELYDVIILDPPAFVKSRARLAEAIRGYKEINLRAMRLLRPGGFLITCSCSHYLQAEQFRALLLDAACDARRSPRLLAQQGQGPDHPIVLGMPETEYLKCFLLEL
jgi:23S rRNA (cytosine1962-C5)-methyltransferase